MPTVRFFSPPIRHLILTAYVSLKATILLFSSTCQSAEYLLQPSIALMAEYDDNVRLQPRDGDIFSLQGESAIFNADFSRDQANQSLSINGQFASRKYDLNDYDSEDISVTLNYQQIFERGSFRLNLSSNDESIRTLENKPENDGFTEQIVTEQRVTKAVSHVLTISGQRQLTERQFLQNQFSAQQRDYESDTRTSYDYFNNSLLWVFSINSTLSTQVNISLSSFRPDKTDGVEYRFIDVARNQYGLSDQVILGVMDFCYNSLDPLDPFNPDTATSLPAPIPNYDSPSQENCFNAKKFSLSQDTVNLQLGLQYQWTENISLDLLIGSSYSETEQDRFSPYAIAVTGELTGNYIQETEQDNLSFNLDLNYQHSARASTSLQASQSQEQTAYGLSVDTQRISLSNRWQINKLSSLNLSLSRVDRDRSLTSNSQALYGDEISQLGISYTKYWKNNLHSNFSYRFRELSKDTKQPNNNNRWILTLTWQPEAISWSK